MLYGTVNVKKGGTTITQHDQTLQTSELNKSSWAKEIEGKISVVNAPVAKFLDVYVPKSTETPPAIDLTGVFCDVDTTGKEVRMYEGLVRCILHEARNVATEGGGTDQGAWNSCARL